MPYKVRQFKLLINYAITKHKNSPTTWTLTGYATKMPDISQGDHSPDTLKFPDIVRYSYPC